MVNAGRDELARLVQFRLPKQHSFLPKARDQQHDAPPIPKKKNIRVSAPKVARQNPDLRLLEEDIGVRGGDVNTESPGKSPA